VFVAVGGGTGLGESGLVSAVGKNGLWERLVFGGGGEGLSDLRPPLAYARGSGFAGREPWVGWAGGRAGVFGFGLLEAMG
jgi:hypothetical protein